MNFFRIWIGFLFVIELYARDNKYAWNSTAARCPKNRTKFVDLSEEVHRLLKQGLKIGYLPPTRYNGKFANSKNLSWDNFLSHEPSDKFRRITWRWFFWYWNHKRLGNLGWKKFIPKKLFVHISRERLLQTLKWTTSSTSCDWMSTSFSCLGTWGLSNDFARITVDHENL